MTNTAKAVSREEPGLAETQQKALVVEVDYFAMSSRIDPNVKFWDPGFAVRGVPSIPEGITHLWVSKHTKNEYRKELYAQAERRGIQIWRCSLFELRHRLLNFWTKENRSLISPATSEDEVTPTLDVSLGISLQPSDKASQSVVVAAGRYHSPIWGNETPFGDDEPVVEDRTGEDEDAIPRLPKGKKSAKDRRLQLLRQSKNRVARKIRLKGNSSADPDSALPVEQNPVPEPAAPKKPSALRLVETPAPRKQVDPTTILGPALDCLVAFEREVFLAHYSRHSAQITRTAKEFGLPSGNVPKILGRAWGRLQQNGCPYDEKSFIAALDRKP